MSNGAMDNGKRIQAVDLITLAMGRLDRVYASPQTSSHHSEAKIALADLKMALDVLTKLSNPQTTGKFCRICACWFRGSKELMRLTSARRTMTF